jgi:hypothetical protein
MRGVTGLGRAFTHSIRYVTCGLLLGELNRAGNKASTTFRLPLMVCCKTGHFRSQTLRGTSKVQYLNLEFTLLAFLYRVTTHLFRVTILIITKLKEKYAKN